MHLAVNISRMLLHATCTLNGTESISRRCHNATRLVAARNRMQLHASVHKVA